MSVKAVSTTNTGDRSPTGWMRLRAIITGAIVVAIAFPVPAVMAGSSDEPMQQAPPANAAEWNEAMAAVSAGLPPADAIDWRPARMREHVAWLSETWECMFGRTPAQGETAPFVDSIGPLADGTYALESWAGESASIELVLTANSTRDELLALIPAGATLHPAIQHAGQAMARVTGSTCSTDIHVLMYHMVVDDEHRTCIVPVNDIPADLFDSMKLAASIQDRGQGVPIDPTPPEELCEEDPCATNARKISTCASSRRKGRSLAVSLTNGFTEVPCSQLAQA